MFESANTFGMKLLTVGPVKPVYQPPKNISTHEQQTCTAISDGDTVVLVSKRVFGLNNLLRAHSGLNTTRRLPDWSRPLLGEELGLPTQRLSKQKTQQVVDSLFPVCAIQNERVFPCCSVPHEGLNLRTSVVHRTLTHTGRTATLR